MTFYARVERSKYEIGGRSELGRVGETRDQLKSDYDFSNETLLKINLHFQQNHDNFRLLACEAANKYYEINGIEVSPESLRLYLDRRRRRYGFSDFEGAVPAVKAQEIRFLLALRKFEGVYPKYKSVQQIISGAIQWIALQDTVNASTVAAALEDMNKALDQLDPRPSNDQIGTVPRDSSFHAMVFTSI
jgi:hypothetical protein